MSTFEHLGEPTRSSISGATIQAQRNLAAAEGTEVTARANYAKALVQFAQATGDILEKNHIEIGDAKQGQSSRPS